MHMNIQAVKFQQNNFNQSIFNPIIKSYLTAQTGLTWEVPTLAILTAAFVGVAFGGIAINHDPKKFGQFIKEASGKGNAIMAKWLPEQKTKAINYVKANIIPSFMSLSNPSAAFEKNIQKFRNVIAPSKPVIAKPIMHIKPSNLGRNSRKGEGSDGISCDTNIKIVTQKSNINVEVNVKGTSWGKGGVPTHTLTKANNSDEEEIVEELLEGAQNIHRFSYNDTSKDRHTYISTECTFQTPKTEISISGQVKSITVNGIRVKGETLPGRYYDWQPQQFFSTKIRLP